jgi:hypothetical protein
MYEEHEKRVEKFQENEFVYQREIERLIEERNQAYNLLTQWKESSDEHSLDLDRY